MPAPTRCSTVSSARTSGEDVEEAALEAVEALPEPQAVVDAYLEAEGLKLEHTQFFGASYKPFVDQIVLPHPSRFEDMAHYYMTAFHELSHSTAHADRVERELDTHFGSHRYGVEELTAEMSAAMLGTHTGLTSESGVVENSAAYLKGWLEKIREDPNIVWVAAQRAQKVVDYIMGVVADAAWLRSRPNLLPSRSRPRLCPSKGPRPCPYPPSRRTLRTRRGPRSRRCCLQEPSRQVVHTEREYRTFSTKRKGD